MRTAAFFALLAVSGFVAGPALGADCAGVFRFQTNDRLSIQEISGLTEGSSAEGPGDTTLVFRPTDWEAASARGKWWLLGVIYGGFSDEGGRVAGGVLWVSNREHFGTGGGGTFRKTMDGISLTLRPTAPIMGCKRGFKIKLDAAGVFTANGVKVDRAIQ